MADQRKTLARCSTEYDIDRCVADVGGASNARGIDVRNTRANGCTIRKVVFMRCAVNRIQFNCGSYVEARLLEPEREAARAGKQIDADRPAAARKIFSSRF